MNRRLKSRVEKTVESNDMDKLMRSVLGATNDAGIISVYFWITYIIGRFFIRVWTASSTAK
jgi:hypothetical protein